VVTLKPMKFKSMENKANQCTHFHIMRQKSHMQTSSKNSKNLAAIDRAHHVKRHSIW